MLKLVHRIDWERASGGVFITLTYPDQLLPRHFDDRTYDRDRFFQKLERATGQPLRGIWRVEFKRRRSGKRKGQIQPHFHFIVFECPFIAWQTIRSAWRSVLCHEGPLSTDIHSLGTREKHGVYISKYCAKPMDSGSLDYASYLNMRGRHWGVHRRNMLPLATEEKFEDISPDKIHKIKALQAANAADYLQEADNGFTLFGSFKADLIKKIREVLLDGEVGNALG